MTPPVIAIASNMEISKMFTCKEAFYFHHLEVEKSIVSVQCMIVSSYSQAYR